MLAFPFSPSRFVTVAYFYVCFPPLDSKVKRKLGRMLEEFLYVSFVIASLFPFMQKLDWLFWDKGQIY